MKRVLLVTGIIILILNSCSKGSSGTGSNTGGGNGGGGGGGNTTVDCSTVTNKAFNADILPIFTSTCATSTSCHATGSNNGPGPLTNYAQISGQKTIIRTVIANGSMPKNGTLSTAQRNSIVCWIDGGAQNN